MWNELMSPRVAQQDSLSKRSPCAWSYMNQLSEIESKSYWVILTSCTGGVIHMYHKKLNMKHDLRDVPKSWAVSTHSSLFFSSSLVSPSTLFSINNHSFG
jgi:hypothetical protein